MSTTKTGAGELIETDAALRALAQRVRRAERVGLDTEFVGERTYVSQLELIQVAVGEHTAVVDCQAVSSLDPLLHALLDDKIEKVLHAGQQDLELFYHLAGHVPAPLFDTQVAAAMVGYGAQPGYAALVERLFHTRVEKTETLTDWSRRPLSATQIAYAHSDVEHLLPMRDRLGARLRELGREEWLREELGRLESPETYRRADPRQMYLRVRGRGGLSQKSLAILRELAAWREEEAQRRNKPRGTILSDELLVDLARRAPESPDAVRNFRGQFARAVERHATAIVDAVHQALAMPREEWPQPPAHISGRTASTGVIELLQAALRVCAEQAHIAPTLVATTADLETLVEAHATQAHAELPLTTGWRGQIAGAKLTALLDGRAVLRLNPKSGRVEFQQRGAKEG